MKRTTHVQSTALYNILQNSIGRAHTHTHTPSQQGVVHQIVESWHFDVLNASKLAWPPWSCNAIDTCEAKLFWSCLVKSGRVGTPRPNHPYLSNIWVFVRFAITGSHRQLTTVTATNIKIYHLIATSYHWESPPALGRSAGTHLHWQTGTAPILAFLNVNTQPCRMGDVGELQLVMLVDGSHWPKIPLHTHTTLLIANYMQWYFVTSKPVSAGWEKFRTHLHTIQASGRVSFGIISLFSMKAPRILSWHIAGPGAASGNTPWDHWHHQL